MSIPIYDPKLSYEKNYQQGPFGLFTEFKKLAYPKPKQPTTLLGLQINTPFGIPAGPLLNSHFIAPAFHYQFDLCTYKTVRTREHSSHPLPNILSIHADSKLGVNQSQVLADTDFSFPISITNSFGVPSFSPDIWQLDMAKSVQMAGPGQALIGSFQGTVGQGRIEDDYALAASLVAETQAPILEANLSCPNEGVNHLLCFDIDKVERIVNAIKERVPDRPLLIKLAYFADDIQLKLLLQRIGKLVDGISTINTLSARPINQQGMPALSANRIDAGVCGDAIRWAGLDMVKRVADLRCELEQNFVLIGVGGVSSIEHYKMYHQAGVDAVMSATGAMWDPMLAIKIKEVELK